LMDRASSAINVQVDERPFKLLAPAPV